MDEIFSSYYGMLETIEINKYQTIGIYCVDEVFKRLLDKYEDRLLKNNLKLISDIKNTFKEDLRILKKKLTTLSKSLSEVNKRMDKKQDKKEVKS